MSEQTQKHPQQSYPYNIIHCQVDSVNSQSNIPMVEGPIYAHEQRSVSKLQGKSSLCCPKPGKLLQDPHDDACDGNLKRSAYEGPDQYCLLKSLLHLCVAAAASGSLL